MPFLIGGAISAGSSILGGLFGGKAASKAGQVLSAAGNKAANAETTATNTAVSGVNAATTAGQGTIATGTTNANAGLTNQFNNLNSIYSPINANLNPYLQAGQQGANQLMAATGPNGSLSQQFNFNPTMASLANTPGYQFNLQQGTQAIQRSAASQGDALGAGTQKSLAQYASGLASNQYQQSYNNALTSFQTNRQNTMQNLTALLGTGQFGSQQLGQVGTAQAGQQNQLALTGSQNTMQGALSEANLGFQGASAAGNFGLQGTQAAGNFLMQGAGGKAAGIVGQSNAYGGALSGAGNAIGGAVTMNNLNKQYGYGYGY